MKTCPNLRSSVDWNRCEKCCHVVIWSAMWIWNIWPEAFTTNVCTMWIRRDDNGWCHDLIWGALWIGTDVKKCCNDINWSAI
jgi:hypothetical protein